MSDDLKEARIRTLKQVQSARKEDAAERVNRAIERLQKMNAKINFTTVAKEANVSVSYLYKYPEIKRHVAEVRNQQRSFPTAPVSEANSSAGAKVIARLKDRIQQLERENQELKRKNEALAGQVYRVHYLQEQVERQQQVIEDLTSRLKDQQSAAKVTSIASKRKATVSDPIQAELESLGIELNPTLSKTLKGASESTVRDAIAALKEQLTKKDLPNPGGWLNQAIKEGWTKSKPISQTVAAPVTPASQMVTANPQPDKELLSLDKLEQLSAIFKQKDE